MDKHRLPLDSRSRRFSDASSRRKEGRKRSRSPSPYSAHHTSARAAGGRPRPTGPKELFLHGRHRSPERSRRRYEPLDRPGRRRSPSRSLSRGRHDKTARWQDSEAVSYHESRSHSYINDKDDLYVRTDGFSDQRSARIPDGSNRCSMQHDSSPARHRNSRPPRRSPSPYASRVYRSEARPRAHDPSRRRDMLNHTRPAVRRGRSRSLESNRTYASQDHLNSRRDSPNRLVYPRAPRERPDNRRELSHPSSPPHHPSRRASDHHSKHLNGQKRSASPGRLPATMHHGRDDRPDLLSRTSLYSSNPQHAVQDQAGPNSRGRNNSAASARGHFQNLSWTPDKGSRGGIAPSERRLPDGDAQDAVKSATIKPAVNKVGPPKQETPLPASSHKDGESEAKSGAQSQAQTVESAGSSVPKAFESTIPTAPKNNSIKFAMKVPIQPALSSRLNVINSVSKPPARPSVFQTSENDARIRRTESLSARGRSLLPRTPVSRYQDYPSFRHPSRSVRQDPRDSPWDDCHSFSHPQDRRPLTTRELDAHSGPRYDRHAPPALKSSRPRRKKFKKVLKRHRRVLVPPRTLPPDWAQSDFIYFPKPDRTSVVGAGTYGKVFKAHNVYLNQCVALKTLPLIKPRRKAGTREYLSRDKKRKRQDRWVRDGLHLTSLREVKLLKSVSHEHENVIGVREFFLEGLSCNLVFDYYEFDMHGIIYSAKVGLPEAMMKDLCLQVFRGLDFLHTKARILHRDIKAANILVSAKGQVRITDFGLAKHVKEQSELDALPWYQKKFEHSNRVITTPYRPPELFLGASVYDGEVDVWSAGCVLFEAFLKQLPFQGTGEDVDHLLTIWKVLGLPNVNLYPAVVELEWYWLYMSRVVPKKSMFKRLYQNKISVQLYHLLRCIFQLDPKKRPTAAQILTHPFFTSEAPLPQNARSILEAVEGDWHELEYKMIRDKEKAEIRRKNEDNVILGYLKHKQSEHERKASPKDDGEHANRREYYMAQQKAFEARIGAHDENMDSEEDHVKQVAEMKRTHGDMYMDAQKRGRYRGHARQKVDEKLLHEAWRWFEEEKKKGNTPVRLLSGVSKLKPFEPLKANRPRPVQKPRLNPAVSNGRRSIMDSSVERDASKRAYKLKKDAYDDRLAKWKSLRVKKSTTQLDKREPNSPPNDERATKKFKECSNITGHA